MPGPSQAEVDAANEAYKAATADREAKQAVDAANGATLEAAVAAKTTSHAEYMAALVLEHQREDEHEALVIAHEPPELPATT